jgi:SAM-dependent methyltransferase
MPQLIYNHLASQSGRSLPVIYKPFDPRLPHHFADRGDVLDYASHVRGGRVLDLGPGDGWPALVIAPFCQEVVGADASSRRVAECQANAQRLGIRNATFIHVPSGAALPFDDDEFDAVTAADSIEQAPDPAATLRELHRVLRPGGRLRMHYEGLAQYRGGREREAWLAADGPPPTHILYFERDLEAETAQQWRLSVNLERAQLAAVCARHGTDLDRLDLSQALLTELHPYIFETVGCTTRHPSCASWLKLICETGFSDCRATHSGRALARQMFALLAPDGLPASLADVDELLRLPVQAAASLAAPLELDPMITAVK